MFLETATKAISTLLGNDDKAKATYSIANLSVGAFRAKFTDFIRPNLYLVHILMPKAMTEFENQSLAFLCREAVFPFYTLSTSKLNYNNLNKNFISNVDFDPATFVFNLDNKNKLFTFFNKWNETIINKDRQFEYKKNYAGTILVQIFDSKGRNRVSVSLYDAFPINIENLQLSYSAENEVLPMSVSFSFDDVAYEIDNSSMPSDEYITHMKERLAVYPKPFSFSWPWDGVIDGVRGFAEGILGKQLTHQLENKVTAMGKNAVNKKWGRNAIPTATKVGNITKATGRDKTSTTITKSSRLFKF